MPSSDAVTRLSTAAVFSLTMEDGFAHKLRSQAKISKPGPTCHTAPVDSQQSIQGTPTTRVRGHAHIQEASHHQRHTNPITEKERVQASKRDLARRPTASQRAARARARRSGREDGTASGRGLTRSAPARRCPRAKKRSQDTKGTSTTAHAPPRAARRLKKNGPAPTQPAALPR